MKNTLRIIKRSLNTSSLAKTELEEFVYWAYRVILLRPPENHQVVQTLAAQSSSEHHIRNQLLTSPEARQQPGFPAISQTMTGNEDAQLIETHVPDTVQHQLFSKVQKVWQSLGETAAYWSVATNDNFLPENIARNVDNFFATGAENVHTLLRTLARNQIDVSSLHSCIDFGCGVGRLSVPLASHFSQVTAVDVSSSHLALATQAFATRQLTNISVVHLTQIAGVHALPSADLIFSIIVLQHNPPPVMLYLLAGLLGKLNPGGVAVIQLPTYLPKGYKFVVSDYLATGGAGMEMHALPQRVVFDTAQKLGISILEVLEDSWTGYGVGSCSNTFVFQRPA